MKVVVTKIVPVTEMGRTTDDGSADLTVRCGVGIASLPEDSQLTPACQTHDNAYQNQTWQKYHTRKETDEKLYTDLRALGATRIAATLMYRLARIFGRLFWENPKTND
jgi:hypothetical protein